MRPVTDKHNVSRAKLAYLIDATACLLYTSILFIVITRLLIIKPSFMTSLLLNDIDSGGYSQITPVICN